MEGSVTSATGGVSGSAGVEADGDAASASSSSSSGSFVFVPIRLPNPGKLYVTLEFNLFNPLGVAFEATVRCNTTVHSVRRMVLKKHNYSVDNVVLYKHRRDHSNLLAVDAATLYEVGVTGGRRSEGVRHTIWFASVFFFCCCCFCVVA